ncbi:MAG: MFS transporter [Clostridium sp.]|nr:MFS transporter [Clostridium sp.]
MTGFIFITTIVPSKANRITEDCYRGTGNGVINSFQYIGSFLGSLVAGSLWGIGDKVAVIFTIVFCIAATVYSKVNLESRRKEYEV